MDDDLLGLLETSKERFFDHDSLINLWHKRLKSAKEYFIVLDGFDECQAGDRKDIMANLSKLCETCREGPIIKILLSSRESTTEEIDRFNATIFRQTLSPETSSKDLSLYAEEVLSEKLSSRELILHDPSLAEKILECISIGGEGM